MGKTISVASADGHTFSAYVGAAEGATRGVVVLQEIFGVNSHIRHMADVFSESGYATVAPALFDRAEKGVELGYTDADLETGVRLCRQISEAAVLADIVASAQTLGVSSLAVVGYCWGGSLSWLAATRTNVFSAASCWYGGAIVETKDATASCPVQMHFGENDDYIPLSAVGSVRAAQPKADVFIYPGVGHGFGCSERGSFDQAAYDLALNRTLTLFGQHLK